MHMQKASDTKCFSGRKRSSLNGCAVGKTPPARLASMQWQERPYQKLAVASEIAQVSEAALSKAEKDGLLTFVRLAGRTLVETASLIAFISRAEPWTASSRGAAARAKRAEVARAALKG